MLKLYPATIAIYEELFQQATLNKNYKHKTTRRDRLLICRFIKWINGKYHFTQVNESLLIQFFEFQFSRYSGIATPKGKNVILLHWIVGQKAIIAWENRNIKKRYLVTWRINKDFKLKLKEAFKEVKVNKNNFLLKVNTHEEQSKVRFYNLLEGYIYCGQMTTLFNPVSDLCNGCNYKQECIERLKLNFEKLYKLRTNEYHNEV
jgi:hypothetical protein